MERLVEGSLHFSGSDLLCSVALWPQDALPPTPAVSLPPDVCPGLCRASPCAPSHRCLTAALASSAHCVSRARGVWVVCARATGSVRTGSWAVGSAAATRASTERPVRCVSWAATGPTALEVRPRGRAGMVGKVAKDSGHGDAAAGTEQALGNFCPASFRSQCVTVPTGCARRGSEGTEAVSVTWVGRASAVTRKSLALSAHRSVTPMPTASRTWLQPLPVSVPRGTRATASTVQVQAHQCPEAPEIWGWISPQSPFHAL